MIISLKSAGWSREISITLITLLLFIVCAPDLLHAEGGLSEDLLFQPGSAVLVTIWQEPDLSGDYSIDSKGYVALPLIGKIQVSRFTKDSLESYLVTEYSNYLRSPIIMVEPLIRIGVLGEVRSPGLYRVSPEAPLWDVIEKSGGLTSKANLLKIKFMRRGEVVNSQLLQAFENGESLQVIGMQSGDQVVVPSSRRVMEWRTIIALVSLGVSTISIVLRQRK